MVIASTYSCILKCICRVQHLIFCYCRCLHLWQLCNSIQVLPQLATILPWLTKSHLAQQRMCCFVFVFCCTATAFSAYNMYCRCIWLAAYIITTLGFLTSNTIRHRNERWYISIDGFHGTSPCCLLIGQYPHHMTLCPPVAIVKRCYGIRLCACKVR